MGNLQYERWEIAQKAEKEYWQHLLFQPKELARIIKEKLELLEIVQKFQMSLNSVLEIGIGPLGIGVINFLESTIKIGIEPLPMERPHFTKTLSTWIECVRSSYYHIQAKGESLPFRENQFNLVVCYNVLDHVQNPREVLMEIHRVLLPDGQLVLGIDTFSILGRLKSQYYTRLLYRETWLVKCHPHSFTKLKLIRLLQESGYQIIFADKERFEWMKNFVGRVRRSLFVAQKAKLGSE